MSWFERAPARAWGHVLASEKLVVVAVLVLVLASAMAGNTLPASVHAEQCHVVV